jgi:hypothetical protein
LEILMFLKLPSKACYKLRQGLHTMLLPKFGVINHIMKRVTFGAWGVFFMSWSWQSLHFKHQIWISCLEGSKEVLIKHWAHNIHQIWAMLSNACFNKIQIADLHANNSWKCHSWNEICQTQWGSEAHKIKIQTH